MTYSVVHFFDDDSVEAVPKIWVKGDYCAWPKNKMLITKYIINKHLPDNTEFTYFKARVLCKSLSKYIL